MKILLIGGLGYIGSYLNKFLHELGFEVDICDQASNEDNGAHKNVKFPFSYTGLTSRNIIEYDCVLWFAGHSSVSKSNADPIGALNNNMINFLDFLKKIPNNKILVIYASTASLYSGLEGPSSENFKILPSENSYDISKFSFDYLAYQFYDNLVGLRMGTLSGVSFNMRTELIFNAMMLSAYKRKEVNIANKEKMRSILFLSDLAEIVKIILDINKFTPGIYNAASYSFTIDAIGKKIADFFSARINYLPDTSTYSFLVDTTKIENQGFKVKLSFEDQMNLFVDDIKRFNLAP